MANVSSLPEKSAFADWIFDYLNGNPQKFAQDGTFDPTSRAGDFLPLLFGGSRGYRRKPGESVPKKPKYSGRFRPGEGPDDVAQQRNTMHSQDFEKGIRYDKRQCDDNWDVEKELCALAAQTLFGYDRASALRGCYGRANDRHSYCVNNGHYNGMADIWTLQDVTGQAQGEGSPDRRPTGQNSNPGSQPQPGKPDDEAKRLAAKRLLMFQATFPWSLMYYMAKPRASNNVQQSEALDRILRNIVIPPSAYPKGMQRAAPLSPPPMLLPTLLGAP